MLDTIAALNGFAREFNVTEVCTLSFPLNFLVTYNFYLPLSQPSLMNFCVTDGETAVATRYISSKVDEAASLVSW